MRTIGLIGGMSWESSAIYYTHINKFVRSHLGGNANARSLMLTVDFAGIEALQHRGEWAMLGREMADAAVRLERGGADCIVLCTNTMHKVAHYIEEAVAIPLLDIVDATAQALKGSGIRRAGLLGTRFTSEDGFYQARMQRHEIEIVTPPIAERIELQRIIYEELCQGQQRDSSRDRMRRMALDLVEEGIDGLILGCTELCLLISEEDSAILFRFHSHSR